jgi:colicin import membrane protein
VFGSWGFTSTKPKAFEIPKSIRAEVVTIARPKPVVQPVAVAKPKPRPTPVVQPKPEPVVKAPEVKAPEVPSPEITVPKELTAEPIPAPIETVPEVTTPSAEELAKLAADAQAEEAALFDDFLADLDAEDAKIENKLAQIDAENVRASQIGEEIESYTAAITQQISQVWSRPVELQLKDSSGLKAKVSVELLPTGELSAVNLEESSGMQTYDQSVLRAIERVRRFNVPEDPEVFEAGGFRRLIITFIPEDLMQL